MSGSKPSESGVIDFDSARVGDPANDLAAASCYGLDRLARVYPEADAAIPRVQFYVGTFALQEALFGVENGDDGAFERGIAAYR
jgi:aminoglycoside 2''-phosphotransferase